MLPGPAVPGCCWIYLHFLWGKLSTRTVIYTLSLTCVVCTYDDKSYESCDGQEYAEAQG